MASLTQAAFGRPERIEQISRLTPEQQQIQQQRQQAAQGRGAGGAFGEAADIFRDFGALDSETARQLEAPELRRFQQQTIPGLAEQFAGFGAGGGVGSSMFANAATQAGVDLSERLGAIRANLRGQAAQGLQSIGQGSLQQQQDTLVRPETFGFFGNLASGIAPGLGQGFGTALASRFNKGIGK